MEPIKLDKPNGPLVYQPFDQSIKQLRGQLDVQLWSQLDNQLRDELREEFNGTS